MPRDPVVYATMLRERLAARDVRCWLVNTGWSGGPHGVGERMSIAFTRRLLQAALDGELDNVAYTPHPVFKVLVPGSCEGIPAGALDQRSTWQDPAAYDAAAAKLAAQFIENFRQYEGRVPTEVVAAGPVTEEVAV
jgi:phosphoenolpyruvate carboxykinase (ATP)